MRTSFVILLGFVALLGSCTEADRCLETRKDLAFDEAGPWGLSASEVHGPLVGSRQGTLTWLGGADAGSLDPEQGESGLLVEISLDLESSVGVELEHVGDGRLACINRLESRGTIILVSDDGMLDEMIEVDFVASEGAFAGQVIGYADLTGYDFGGGSSWMPTSDGQLFLQLSWIDDAGQSLRGWLIWGEPSVTTVEGAQVNLAGSGRVLAQFEA